MTINGEKATSIKAAGYEGEFWGYQVSTRRYARILDDSSLNLLIRQGGILLGGFEVSKIQLIFKPNKIKTYKR